MTSFNSSNSFISIDFRSSLEIWTGLNADPVSKLLPEELSCEVELTEAVGAVVDVP